LVKFTKRVKGTSLENEMATAWDKDGKIVMPNILGKFSKEKNTYVVTIPKNYANIFRQRGDVSLGHNHVFGKSFSDEDWVEAMDKNVAELIAIGERDGKYYRYKIQRPSNGWARIPSDDLRSLFSDLQIKHDGVIDFEVSTGKLDKGLVLFEVMHRINVELSAKFNVKYTVERIKGVK